MKEAALFTFTLLLGVYYFSTPKRLNPLEQIFIGLICSFILSCYISIFADDLGWWKVNKDSHLVFKIVEIVAKTFLLLMFIPIFLNGRNRFLVLLFYLFIFQLISWANEGLKVVEYKNWWILVGVVLDTLTLMFLTFLQKKFHQVLMKEGLVDYEGSSTS